jgi:hypothetical protein
VTDVPALQRIHETRFLLLEGGGGALGTFLGIFQFTASDGYIRSQVFICPECGHLWGRMTHTIFNQPNLHHSFEAVTRPCSEHGDGSLITQIHTEHIKFLPRKLLEYEILETHYAGKDRPPTPERRPSLEGQPNALDGSARYG